jgi:hypothetical protein
MKVVLGKRFNNGFTFHASYAYAKSLGYNDPNYYASVGTGETAGTTNTVQDIGNPHPDWPLLPPDVRHAVHALLRLRSSFRLRAEMVQSGGLMDQLLLGGWSLNGIQRYQSGFPLHIVTINTLPIFNYVLRPNRVPEVPMSNHNPLGKFNPSTSRIISKAPFSQPAPFTLGNFDGDRLLKVWNALVKVFLRSLVPEIAPMQIGVRYAKRHSGNTKSWSCVSRPL